MDAIVYDRMFVGNSQGPDANPRGLERWTIDPSSCSVERHALDPTPQEFPRIDTRRTGRPHRFVYSLGLPETFEEHVSGATHIFKHDVKSGARQRHVFS